MKQAQPSPIPRPRMEFGTVGVHAVDLVAIAAFVLKKSRVFAYDEVSLFSLLKVPDFSICVSSSLYNAVCWTITCSHTAKPECGSGSLCTNNASKILVSRMFGTRNLCVSRSSLYRRHFTKCVHEQRYMVCNYSFISSNRLKILAIPVR